MILFFFYSVRNSFSSSRPQYGILGTIIFRSKSLRSSAVCGGRLKRPSPCRFRSAPGRDRVRRAERDKRKVRNFIVFWAVYARAILGSWHMQSLNGKTNGKTFISKLASFFLLLLFFLFSGGWMGKNKALAHHTSTYFHTRRVSI